MYGLSLVSKCLLIVKDVCSFWMDLSETLPMIKKLWKRPFRYLNPASRSDIKVKVKSAYEPSGPSGRSLSQFQSHETTRSISTPPPPGWDASPWQGYPQHHGTNLYTWVDRCTMRVKCLAAQEHNIMSLAKAQTWTAYSRVERTNHEANAPPTTAVNRNISDLPHFSTLAMGMLHHCVP